MNRRRGDDDDQRVSYERIQQNIQGTFDIVVFDSADFVGL